MSKHDQARFHIVRFADELEDIFDTIEAALEAFPELSIFLKLLKVSKWA